MKTTWALRWGCGSVFRTNNHLTAGRSSMSTAGRAKVCPEVVAVLAMEREPDRRVELRLTPTDARYLAHKLLFQAEQIEKEFGE